MTGITKFANAFVKADQINLDTINEQSFTIQFTIADKLHGMLSRPERPPR